MKQKVQKKNTNRRIQIENITSVLKNGASSIDNFLDREMFDIVTVKLMINVIY